MKGPDIGGGRQSPAPDAASRICLLALSMLVDDPRVRRQGDLFHARGWEVSAAGIPGGRSPPPAWRILGEAEPPITRNCARARAVTGAAAPGRSIASRRERYSRGATAAITQWRRIWRALEYRARMIRLRVQPRLAQAILWNDLAISAQLRAMYVAAVGVAADIWLANDWTVLPLAARLARENGGVYAYDTHEFATEEYAERASWRRWTRPLVYAIERAYIGNAAAVSTVSAGIAERLDRLYLLPRPTLVVRNTPHYEAIAFRPTDNTVRVLYHGIVVPGRGLELAIESVALWRPEFELAIRGPENPDLTPLLRKRIADLALGDRVRLLPPVPMTALVREAASFDVGFFALPGHSRHNVFALPNKIFEYIMAGLCLCTTDLPEIAAIVGTYDVGVTIPGFDAEAIARAINGLDRGHIDRCKQNALQAARELCWERESERLVERYAGLLPRPARPPG